MAAAERDDGPRLLRQPADELARSGAAIVAEALRAAADRKSAVTLGVVGGSSVPPVYDALARTDAPWDQVHVLLADERVVPGDSDERNLRLVEQRLTGPLIDRGVLPPDHVHPFEPDPTRAAEGVAAYRRLLDRLGGAFDVVLLAAGDDGHTASLFPDHPALDATAPFVLVEDSPKPPPTRVTATPPVLTAATGGILLFVGERKRTALARYLDPDATVADCPSTLFRAVSGGSVLTDLDVSPTGP